jgi:transcription elongation factor Elf1
MGTLDRAQFPITCAKCGHSSMRRPEQLRREPHPHCTSCGGDVSAEADKMLRAVDVAERVLTEDFQTSRRDGALQFKPTR